MEPPRDCTENQISYISLASENPSKPFFFADRLFITVILIDKISGQGEAMAVFTK